jgi:flagellar hook-length control protein FliK
MTAQVSASLPLDPTPPPVRPQASESGVQFLTLLAPPRTQHASHSVSSTAVGSSAAATPHLTTTGSVPRPTGSQSSNGDHGSGDQSNNGNQRDLSKSDGAAQAALIPVPIPPLLVPQPIASGATLAAGSVTLTGAAATPQPVPASPADAAALLLLAKNALVTADATQPGTAGTGGIDSQAPASAAAGQTVQPGQVLPSMAANLSMRIAAAATTLVSQPRAALATATPEITAPAKSAGTMPDPGTLDRAPPSTDVAHASGKPGAAASVGGIDDLLAAAAKDAAGQSQLVHANAEQNAPSPTVTGSNAGSSNLPQVVAMAPPTGAIANEMPMALPIPPHVVAEQVAVTLRQAVSSGSDHIQIQLQPADLGAVDVKLSINHDGRVTMVVSADRSDTLNLLQQDAGSLAQALRDAGLQADSSSLSFNLRGGYQFNQQQGAVAGAPLVDDLAAGSIDGIDAAATTRQRAHAGSLDIHV